MLRSPCSTPQTHPPLAKVFIALAALHASFAYYLQRRIVVGMTKRGQQTVNQQELAREAGRIMLYDIGVCLYSILYVCAWCWCPSCVCVCLFA